ncbi:hypothetical protein B0H14DRAFT_842023 [Mycena olivaceomarginata]|nr:hypothetical protein B0H14DRAFT_842023 [Mycena olivaceomarginata]
MNRSLQHSRPSTTGHPMLLLLTPSAAGSGSVYHLAARHCSIFRCAIQPLLDVTSIKQQAIVHCSRRSQYGHCSRIERIKPSASCILNVFRLLSRKKSSSIAIGSSSVSARLTAVSLKRRQAIPPLPFSRSRGRSTPHGLKIGRFIFCLDLVSLFFSINFLSAACLLFSCTLPL